MSEVRTAVYFICDDISKDPAGPRVLARVRALRDPQPCGVQFDGREVLAEADPLGNRLVYVPTRDVISHDYPHFVPFMREHFSDVDIAGCVNWHEGANAPDAIFTVHTTGDVVAGVFGPIRPRWVRALMLQLERARAQTGMDTWSVQTEGTHWSGILHRGRPEWVSDYPGPLVDIEIGSSPASWSNATAVDVVARGITGVFQEPEPTRPLRSVLCIGGVHVESAFVRAVLEASETHPVAISHVLPNQWLVSGHYEEPSGIERLHRCIQSIEGGVHGIAFHDNLKGKYKALARDLATDLGVPLFKHRDMREPSTLPLW